MSFFEDWGPLNLGMVYKVCILIHELLEVCFSDYFKFGPLRLSMNILEGQGDRLKTAGTIHIQ